jgi:hypothetical protein
MNEETIRRNQLIANRQETQKLLAKKRQRLRTISNETRRLEIAIETLEGDIAGINDQLTANASPMGKDHMPLPKHINNPKKRGSQKQEYQTKV